MQVVLLVEDELLVAMAQAEALADAGFQVRREVDGASALAASGETELAAAIIDMGLPDCSGVDVARGLRSRYPALPMLICTGYEAGAIAEVIDGLALRVVEKPVDEASLVSILREQMQRAERPDDPAAPGGVP